MAIWRAKRSLTAGELTPLIHNRPELDAHKKGCRVLQNMVLLSQGPALRRPGTKFIWDISSFVDSNFTVREIPFVFSETQAYSLLFLQDGTDVNILFAINGGLVESTPGTPYSVTMSTTWTVEDLDYAQSYDYLILTHPDNMPQQLVRNAHDNWTLQSITSDGGYVSYPSGDWTAGNGYPRFVTFHDQRVVYGSTAAEPNTIWGSKAGDLFNHTAVGGSPTPVDDPIKFTLNSGRQNKIQWMHSQKKLLIGTIGDEWSVTGSDGGLITPDSILAIKHTDVGCTKIPPVQLNSDLYYLNFYGKAVYNFTFDFNQDGYESDDKSILAEHLTRDDKIVSWTYQQSPSSIVWATTASGSLLGMTSQKAHKVLGWHHHHTDGEFLAVNAVPGQTEDEVYCLVKRNINGGNKLYLELMDSLRIPTTATDVRYLDASVVYSGVAKSAFTTGLSHLEGETISVLADGSEHPELTVTSGAVTLQKDATHVVFGLPYDSEIEPLLNSTSSGGDSSARVQQIINVHIYLLNSLLFEYATSRDEYEFEPFRGETDQTGTALDLYTGIKKVPWPEGFSNDPTLIIRQNKPFPLTITAIIDELEVFN